MTIIDTHLPMPGQMGVEWKVCCWKCKIVESAISEQKWSAGLVFNSKGWRLLLLAQDDGVGVRWFCPKCAKEEA